MELNLEGKVAIVTGGASGIGEACVKGYAREKANVVIADINIDKAKDISQNSAKKGSKIIAVKTDVTKQADSDNLIKVALEEFGHVDILVNDAGVCKAKNMVDVSEQEYDWMFDINVRGIFHCMKAVIPHMINNKYGKIINLSSQVGKEGYPKNSIYSATKFAVMGLTQAMAKELADYNINVNAVCPGIVPTNFYNTVSADFAKEWGCKEEEVLPRLYTSMCLLKRPQLPEEIASVILFLSSDISKNMTGQGINVTGGAQMH